jgi:hypothetical protein
VIVNLISESLVCERLLQLNKLQTYQHMLTSVKIGERFDAGVRPRLEISQPRLDVRKKTKFSMLESYRPRLDKFDKSLPG